MIDKFNNFFDLHSSGYMYFMQLCFVLAVVNFCASPIYAGIGFFFGGSELAGNLFILCFVITVVVFLFPLILPTVIIFGILFVVGMALAYAISSFIGLFKSKKK